MRTDKSYMVVILHFKLYPALFLLKWLISIPNISAVRGNVVCETIHVFYRTAIDANQFKQLADQYYLLTVVPSTGNNGFIYDKTYQLPLETLNKKWQCSWYFSAAHHICHSRMQSWLDRKEEAD